MKRYFSFLTIFILAGLYLSLSTAHAQTACGAKVVIHYHRFDADYTNYEFHTWDNGTGGTQPPVPITGTDDFGGLAEITVCDDAKDQIGLIAKVVGTWNKDGIDANKDGDIDNKMIDVTDIRGTTKTKDIYVVEGAEDVYYQNVLNDNYFGKPGTGNLVVVYYNPSGNTGWDDFWTWSTNSNADANGVPFDYNLGISGGTDPNVFRVAILSVPATADDQIGFVLRKDKAWTTKDTDWTSTMTADETDDYGNTYKTTGDRLINVSDIKGAGTEFIFVIGGQKTIYEDFSKFVAEAFKLEFTSAQFRTKTALTIEFNQAITYGATGPDVTKFTVADENGNTIPISMITYDSLATSGKTFNIVLTHDIAQNTNYTVSYTYDQFSETKTTTSPTTISDSVFANVNQEPAKKTTNYVGVVVAGVLVVIVAGAGIWFALNRRH